MSKPMMIEKPLAIMFEADGHIVCHIHQPPDYTHEHYGLLVCDLVRKVADAYGVSEDDVWHWVDRERHNHTADIRHPC